MELFQITVKNARQIAAELEIPGRSKMNKAELVDAINATGTELEYDAETREFSVKAPASEVVEFSAPKDEPVELDNRVRIDITRYDQGKADARMNDRYGFEYWAQVVRQGRRWVLIDSRNGEKNFTIRAGSLAKLAKRWAAKLDNWADDIRVVREF